MVNGVTDIHNASYPTQRGSRNKIIEGIISKIRKGGITLALSKDELYLVIDEALTNAMEHGNGWDPAKKVSVRVSHNDATLDIFIEDEGRGFDYGGAGDSASAIRNLKPRGRGIYIIRQFCAPSWNERGNIIALRFEISR